MVLWCAEARHWATGSVPALVESGWMMFSVKASSRHFIVVSTMAGVTTHIANTLMTSPSPAMVAFLIIIIIIICLVSEILPD